MTPDQWQDAIDRARAAEADARHALDEAEGCTSHLESEYAQEFPWQGPRTQMDTLWDETIRLAYGAAMEQMFNPLPREIPYGPGQVITLKKMNFKGGE